MITYNEILISHTIWEDGWASLYCLCCLYLAWSTATAFHPWFDVWGKAPDWLEGLFGRVFSSNPPCLITLPCQNVDFEDVIWAGTLPTYSKARICKYCKLLYQFFDLFTAALASLCSFLHHSFEVLHAYPMVKARTFLHSQRVFWSHTITWFWIGIAYNLVDYIISTLP